MQFRVRVLIEQASRNVDYVLKCGDAQKCGKALLKMPGALLMLGVTGVSLSVCAWDKVYPMQ